MCAHAYVALPAKTQSGYFIWHAVLKVEVVTVGGMQETRLQQFEAKVFFHAGMEYDKYVQATRTFKAEFMLLAPEDRPGRDSLLKMLFEKMTEPAQAAAQAGRA